MSARGAVLMVQGTSSSAGKSFLVAGLCRLFAQEGLAVAPFKAQNMSNNAFVTIDGHEMGRAQAVQAQAARVLPHVDMNPVLLKPEADYRSQVVLMGRVLETLPAAAYHELKPRMWGEVMAALDRLRAQYELVICEGAGSPAEINLKARDITNMRVALYAEAPVLIVGDIDRGGVFAHLYGTHALLEPAEQALVKGFIINRFRGDASLLEPALTDIERMTGVPVVGVVPWVHDHGLPEEDAVALERRHDAAGPFNGVDVAVVRFPRIANFDDFDPLEAEPGVHVRYVDAPGGPTPDLLVLPGTKATIADREWMRERGLDAWVRDAVARGAAVVGICGGLQMLGMSIDDSNGTEGASVTSDGLGLLDTSTRFRATKVTRQTGASVARDDGLLAGTAGMALQGYEIHAGETQFGSAPSVVRDDGQALGVSGHGGWVFGCYLHGLFQAAAFRQQLLANVAARRGKRFEPGAREREDPFDRVAGVLRSSLDLPRIFRMARRDGP